MILLDTSGLFAFYHKSERQHANAVAYFHAATGRLTHGYVIAEFVALAERRRLQRSQALDFVRDLHNNPSVEVVYVDEALHLEAIDLLRQRLDKPWSLCDAVSFLVMQRRGITESLTTDHHFEQAGFVRLLKP